MSVMTPLPPLRRPDAPSAPGPEVVPRPGPAMPAEHRAPPASALPNPSLRLDASLGLVVLEFRAADGTARTIPSERQLEAYRSAARAHHAREPLGAGDPAGT